MNVTDFRKRLLGSTMIGGLTVAAATLAMASAAQAQSTPPQGQPQQDESTSIDDVVVTGSRIARQDYAATSPIVTVDAEDFQATGSVTIDTLINDLPQFVPSINSTSNNPSNGGPGQHQPARPRHAAHAGADERPPGGSLELRRHGRHQPDPGANWSRTSK